jgi:hypothetical protein
MVCSRETFTFTLSFQIRVNVCIVGEFLGSRGPQFCYLLHKLKIFVCVYEESLFQSVMSCLLGI